MLVLAGALSGCAAPLFRAGFDSDPLGGPPVARPPGPPDDNVLNVARDGSVTVMMNGSSASDRRVLVAANAAGGVAQLFAASAPLGSNYQRGQPVFASWQGFQVYGRTIISAWEGHFNTVAEFEITNGEVRAGGRVLGRIADPQSGGGHVIIWRLDPAAATSVLTVFPDRGAGAPTGTRPQTFTIADSRLANLGPARIMGLTYQAETTDQDFGFYLVDDILIGQRRPPEDPPRMAPPPGG